MECANNDLGQKPMGSSHADQLPRRFEPSQTIHTVYRQLSVRIVYPMKPISSRVVSLHLPWYFDTFMSTPNAAGFEGQRSNCEKAATDILLAKESSALSSSEKNGARDFPWTDDSGRGRPVQNSLRGAQGQIKVIKVEHEHTG